MDDLIYQVVKALIRSQGPAGSGQGQQISQDAAGPLALLLNFHPEEIRAHLFVIEVDDTRYEYHYLLRTRRDYLAATGLSLTTPEDIYTDLERRTSLWPRRHGGRLSETATALLEYLARLFASFNRVRSRGHLFLVEVIAGALESQVGAARVSGQEEMMGHFAAANSSDDDDSLFAYELRQLPEAKEVRSSSPVFDRAFRDAAAIVMALASAVTPRQAAELLVALYEDQVLIGYFISGDEIESVVRQLGVTPSWLDEPERSSNETERLVNAGFGYDYPIEPVNGRSDPVEPVNFEENTHDSIYIAELDLGHQTNLVYALNDFLKSHYPRDADIDRRLPLMFKRYMEFVYHLHDPEPEPYDFKLIEAAYNTFVGDPDTPIEHKAALANRLLEESFAQPPTCMLAYAYKDFVKTYGITETFKERWMMRYRTVVAIQIMGDKAAAHFDRTLQGLVLECWRRKYREVQETKATADRFRVLQLVNMTLSNVSRTDEQLYLLEVEAGKFRRRHAAKNLVAQMKPVLAMTKTANNFVVSKHLQQWVQQYNVHASMLTEAERFRAESQAREKSQLAMVYLTYLRIAGCDPNETTLLKLVLSQRELELLRRRNLLAMVDALTTKKDENLLKRSLQWWHKQHKLKVATHDLTEKLQQLDFKRTVRILSHTAQLRQTEEQVRSIHRRWLLSWSLSWWRLWYRARSASSTVEKTKAETQAMVYGYQPARTKMDLTVMANSLRLWRLKMAERTCLRRAHVGSLLRHWKAKLDDVQLMYDFADIGVPLLAPVVRQWRKQAQAMGKLDDIAEATRHRSLQRRAIALSRRHTRRSNQLYERQYEFATTVVYPNLLRSVLVHWRHKQFEIREAEANRVFTHHHLRLWVDKYQLVTQGLEERVQNLAPKGKTRYWLKHWQRRVDNTNKLEQMAQDFIVKKLLLLWWREYQEVVSLADVSEDFGNVILRQKLRMWRDREQRLEHLATRAQLVQIQRNQRTKLYVVHEWKRAMSRRKRVSIGATARLRTPRSSVDISPLSQRVVTQPNFLNTPIKSQAWTPRRRLPSPDKPSPTRRGPPPPAPVFEPTATDVDLAKRRGRIQPIYFPLRPFADPEFKSQEIRRKYSGESPFHRTPPSLI